MRKTFHTATTRRDAIASNVGDQLCAVFAHSALGCSDASGGGSGGGGAVRE